MAISFSVIYPASDWIRVSFHVSEALAPPLRLANKGLKLEGTFVSPVLPVVSDLWPDPVRDFALNEKVP